MTLIIWPYILRWPTSKLHNLNTISLTCRKISPTLWMVMMFYNSFTNSHCVMFIYLECGTSWTLCHRTGPSQCLQYNLLDLNFWDLRWSIMTYQNRLWSTTIIIWPYILIWPTSGLHNLDTIFLTCHKVSLTIRVIMTFYNSFTISHCIMFIYL